MPAAFDQFAHRAAAWRGAAREAPRGRVTEIRENPRKQLNPMEPLTVPNEEKYKLAEWPNTDGRILQNERWLD